MKFGKKPVTEIKTPPQGGRSEDIIKRIEQRIAEITHLAKAGQASDIEKLLSVELRNILSQAR